MTAQPSQRTDAEQARIAHFKHLTEVALPAKASEQHWPIRFDHCFKRICLDHAFQDVWYKHLRRPAERYIGGTSLDSAIECAEALLEGNLERLQSLNSASLTFRGKARKAP